jgi:hypothetical protein
MRNFLHRENAEKHEQRQNTSCAAKKGGSDWVGARAFKVTLVAAVLTRKSTVHPSIRFPVSSPYTTTIPETIAMQRKNFQA